MRAWLIAVVAGVLGLVTGLLASRHSPRANPHLIPTQAEAALVPKIHPARKVVQSLPPALDATDFATQLRKLSSASWRRKWEQARDLARSIPPQDASNALATAEKILPRQEWYNFRYQLLQKWAEADPQAVLAYGQSLKNRNDGQQAISTALQEWAKREPEAALAWVEKQPLGQQRQNFLSAALQGLAEEDPKKALERLNSVPNSQRRWIRDQIIQTLAQTDPKQAAELALQNDRGSSRYGGGFPGEGALGSVLQKWVAQDAEAAVSWLQAQPESIRKRRSVAAAAGAVAAQDPASAMRILELVPPGEQREQTLATVLNNWSQRDVDALRAWTDSRTDPREKSLGLIACAQGLAGTDPAAGAAALKNARADERSAWTFQNVFAEYAQRDPQAAVAMAQSLSDNTGRSRAISGALAGWAQTDPQSAANYAMTLPGGPTRNQAISELARGWADRDPKAALEWLKTVPNAAVQRDAIQSVLWTVSESSPQTAAEYVSILPAGQNQLNLVGQLAQNWAQTDFDSALAWVNQLPEGQSRNTALQQISGAWIQNDIKAAAEFAKGQIGRAHV